MSGTSRGASETDRLRISCKEEPTHGGAALREAQRLVSEVRLDEAIDLLDAALESNRDDVRLWISLIGVHLKAGDDARPLSLLKEARSRGLDGIALDETTARVEAAVGDIDQMRATLIRIRGQSRGDARMIARSFMLEGELEGSLGNVDEALAAYEAADVANPASAALQWPQPGSAASGRPTYARRAYQRFVAPTRRALVRPGSTAIGETSHRGLQTAEPLTVSPISRTLIDGGHHPKNHPKRDSHGGARARSSGGLARTSRVQVAASRASPRWSSPSEPFGPRARPGFTKPPARSNTTPLPRSRSAVALMTSRTQLAAIWATREFFQTQNLVIGSRDIAKRVVRKLGLHEDPTYLPQDDDRGWRDGQRRSAASIALQRVSRSSPSPTRGSSGCTRGTSSRSARGSSPTQSPRPTSTRRSKTDSNRRIGPRIGYESQLATLREGAGRR